MQTTKTPQDVPLFGAEDLRKLERINAEIERNGRAGRKHQPAMPLFEENERSTHDV